MTPWRIGSRGSDLALWQSRTVLTALRRAAPAAEWQSEITVITTRGDIDPTPYLAGSVEKGFFTRELEVALLERRIDLVVHSLKDLPTAEPAGLWNRTILPRASAADWLLIRPEFHAPRNDGLLPIRAGARVGASSLRRTALLGRYAPQAQAVPLRGNVPTRLRKLAAGENVEGIVLAAAGLTRLELDLSPFVLVELAPEWWVPAPGQGALAAQCRAGDAEIEAQAAAIRDSACARAVWLEREFLRVIEGGCSTPFGCHVIGDHAWIGIATDAGWAANSVKLPPDLSEDSQRDSFIRAAVAGCKPGQSEVDPGTLGGPVHAR
ncbi:MAG TPA: hydroxymethylbilane synthase [Steroidobacteraceae bacterium]|jgi:hydroxymethylbilane synthase|nr:hydroxymethylbilane synthase [Steroidobacteraceae bacterium]